MNTRTRSLLLAPACAGMVAALLTAQLVAGMGMAHCAMHDMAEPGMSMAHHQHHPGNDRGPAHGAPCNCLGACHAPALGMLPARAVLPALVPLASARVAVVRISQLLPVPPRLLPFAIGPPPAA